MSVTQHNIKRRSAQRGHGTDRSLETRRRDTVKLRLSIFAARVVANRVVETGEAGAVTNCKKADRKGKKHDNRSPSQSHKQCNINVEGPNLAKLS